MEDKYLSVITNFGCHYKCPYCVVRENNLHIPNTTIEGLNELVGAIDRYKCTWISVSGGGDPLYNYHEHKDWYEKFFSIIPKNIKTEMHTSYISIDFPYEKFDRVVYHIRDINKLNKIKKHNNQIVRVVFVVTESFTNEYIDEIVKDVKRNSNIDELSFRQMIDSNFQATNYCIDYLRSGHKKDWWYIEQCDYNIYYCENKISFKYEDFQRNVKEK